MEPCNLTNSHVCSQPPVIEPAIDNHELSVPAQETQVHRTPAAYTASSSSTPYSCDQPAELLVAVSADNPRKQDLVMPDSAFYTEHISKAVFSAIASLELQQKGVISKKHIFLNEEIKTKRHKKGCKCMLCDSEATTEAATTPSSTPLAIDSTYSENDT